MTFSGTISRIASSTSVFEALICAQCDEWQCSARDRGCGEISLAERRPARSREDQSATRGRQLERLQNAVKRIRHDHARMIYPLAYYLDVYSHIPCKGPRPSRSASALLGSTIVISRFQRPAHVGTRREQPEQPHARRTLHVRTTSIPVGSHTAPTWARAARSAAPTWGTHRQKPSDLTRPVSNGRATGEHEPLGEHESKLPSARTVLTPGQQRQRVENGSILHRQAPLSADGDLSPPPRSHPQGTRCSAPTWARNPMQQLHPHVGDPQKRGQPGRPHIDRTSRSRLDSCRVPHCAHVGARSRQVT
jgi:hypothetical protein